MAAKRTAWREKLEEDRGLPKVIEMDQSRSKRWGTGTFVIPSPKEVDALMRRVRKGKLTTIDALRKTLAKRHGATMACPVTTGIFAWIAAHAAAEAEAAKIKHITPYWRTLKTGGELNPKYPGGITVLKRKLIAEGHKVVPKGKRFIVVDFDKRLATLAD